MILSNLLDELSFDLENWKERRAKNLDMHLQCIDPKNRTKIEERLDKFIYKHFALDTTDESRTAMQEHIAANPKGRHGKHEYHLDDWGLTSEEVTNRFAPYIERFNIKME